MACALQWKRNDVRPSSFRRHDCALIPLLLPALIMGCAVLPTRYVSRPPLSQAPEPVPGTQPDHYDLTPLCGADHVVDVYTLSRPVEEVERYYAKQMLHYCRPAEGWQVQFNTMDCRMWERETQHPCRYAACVVNDKAPSLYETFSVEVFRLSSTETYVIQSHGLSYLRQRPPDVECGE